MFELAPIFVFIIFIVWLFSLQSRISRLEQLSRREPQASKPTENHGDVAPQVPKIIDGFGLRIEHPVAPAQRTIDEEPTWLDAFFAWAAEDWTLKLGALIVIIGIGWFVTYAFLNNWIGPVGRISLGMFLGVLLLCFGWSRMRGYPKQGSIFLVLGSTTILLTTFAARSLYQFFTPESALAIMFLSTAFVAYVSVAFRVQSLALISLVMAAVVPALTNAPPSDYVGLFVYLFVVTLGAVWIVTLTGWNTLTPAALVMIGGYSVPHILGEAIGSNRPVLLLIAYAFAAVFFLTNTAGMLRRKVEDMMPDMIAAMGNGVFLLAWITNVAPEVWRSSIIAAWMVIFTVGAFIIFKVTQKKEPFYIYAGIGVAMLAAATSAELSGATLTLAYTIESAMVAVCAYYILGDIDIGETASLLLVGPMVLSVQSIGDGAWQTHVIHEHFFVLLALAATLLILGVLFGEERASRGLGAGNKIAGALVIAGSIYAYILLWLSLQAGVENKDFATMMALIVYTLVGLITHVYGKLNSLSGTQRYGSLLLGAVIAHLFIVDVWGMALTGRIITFFLVGALLMSTAFIGKKSTNTNQVNI